MTTWRWIAPDVVLAIHDQQLARHGGGTGVRDIGLIESALARPRNRVAYGAPDAAELAAAYAHGVAKAHGFVDGNKRVAWVTARLLLADNGYALKADPLDVIKTVENLAAGSLSEEELANWFQGKISKV